MSGIDAAGPEPSELTLRSGPTAFDCQAIKNVLARYCEALDTKNFELLEDVFAHDVVADYPFNSDLRGVEALSGAIRKRYVDIS
jgi:predicted xylose isomerase-like sugar epimerase